MKRIYLLFSLLLSITIGYGQNITVTPTGDYVHTSLDLKIIAQLFAEAINTEHFEILLNNPDSAYSNLDLNGDGQVDYLRVVETGSNNSRLWIIQAVLAPDIYQDVASIYVTKNEQHNVTVQIIGDKYVFGDEYIIEPVYIHQLTIYKWLWNVYWTPWRSPWYWNRYPSWWYHRHCCTYDRYWYSCYNFNRSRHHCSFHHRHVPNHNYHHIHSTLTRQDYSHNRTGVYRRYAGPQTRYSQTPQNRPIRQQTSSTTQYRSSNPGHRQSSVYNRVNPTVRSSGHSSRSSNGYTTRNSTNQSRGTYTRTRSSSDNSGGRRR